MDLITGLITLSAAEAEIKTFGYPNGRAAELPPSSFMQFRPEVDRQALADLPHELRRGEDV